MIKQKYLDQEQVDIVPVNIVYDTCYVESVPVPCYFTSHIHLAYKIYNGRFDKGKGTFAKELLISVTSVKTFLLRKTIL